jgi:DNA-binding CsgD family transcriptional regulator
MSQDQIKKFLSAALFFYVLFAAFDIYSDLADGATWRHLGIECALLSSALLGCSLLIWDYLRSRKNISQLHAKLVNLQASAEQFQKNNKAFTQGLSQAIDAQFELWQLSRAEKEVALFLMKGFSLKEIGQLRESSERTVRSQSNSIYQKSSLSGRAELTAFFLEDLLSSSQPNS